MFFYNYYIFLVILIIIIIKIPIGSKDNPIGSHHHAGLLFRALAGAWSHGGALSLGTCWWSANNNNFSLGSGGQRGWDLGFPALHRHHSGTGRKDTQTASVVGIKIQCLENVGDAHNRCDTIENTKDQQITFG